MTSTCQHAAVHFLVSRGTMLCDDCRVEHLFVAGPFVPRRVPDRRALPLDGPSIGADVPGGGAA